MNKIPKKEDVKDQINKLDQKFKDQINKLDQKLKDQVSKLEQKQKDQVNKIDQKYNDQFKKLADQANNFNSNLKEQINKLDQNIKEQEKSFDEKIEDLILIFDNKLEEQKNTLDKKLMDFNSIIENQINKLGENIQIIKDEMLSCQGNFRGEIQTQEDINISIRDGLNDVIKRETSSIDSRLKEIRAQQDTMKISVDVLDKQVFEKAKALIYSEIKMAHKNKEKEILISLWIDELKDIISNINKLKQTHPKDLKINLNEISRTIELFKQKLAQ